MNKVYLSRNDGLYNPMGNSIENLLLEKITFLLLSDVGHHLIESFKRSVMNTTSHTIHGNMLRLEKKGEIILISDDYIQDDEERLQWAIEIKRDELIKILDQWTEICRTKPPYFVISREEDSIRLKGCQSLDEVI